MFGTNGPLCAEPDCGRPVWFTAEQLCRKHGLAAHLDDPQHVGAIPDDDPLWVADPPKPTRARKQAQPEEA